MKGKEDKSWNLAKSKKLYSITIGMVLFDEDKKELVEVTNWRCVTVIAVDAEDAIYKIHNKRQLEDKREKKKEPYIEHIESVDLIRELGNLVE